MSISPILLIAKRAEIFNHVLNLAWDKSKAVFNKEEIDQLKAWFKKNELDIRSSRKINLFWQKNSILIEKDQSLSPMALLKKLDDLNYIKTHLVASPGDYAHRGEIIDIFGINYDKPLRIEFIGNRVERIYFLKKEEIKLLKLEEKFRAPKEALFNLTSGDYVVHLDHGIGRFKGFLLRQGKKYYEIEYAAKDILLVPMGLEDKLSPYLGFVEPKLTRLGGDIWSRIKKKAKENALKLAKELLALYAKREISLRAKYEDGGDIEEQLETSFDYDLTRDQRKTWQEIKKDLSKTKPMDRIICGDVGFGKTEIALRAALRVALNKRQIALISPTTILADQHYLTFSERLKGLPVELKMLTRLTPKGEQGKTLKKLENGHVDILIGTHRLLSRDIKFKNLGLLIIDEEQRFGVKQKEKLKEMKSSVDILSLSATPIPRTLHMALSSLKDISLITTPPPYKQAPKTHISLFNKDLVKKVIKKEIKRNGQVYYLHNRIGTLSSVEEKLKKILPEIRFASLHGRMNEQTIIKTIHGFRQGKYDCLIATTIIENGLDLKNVNTLIVEDATRLGLAQAHQIRGRVGRGEKQAYAYFLYPKYSLSKLAKERLSALEKFSYLGAGYQLASKDLEIRGAGNLLGKEQSGSINKVGLNLYYQILNQAIEELKRNN